MNYKYLLLLFIPLLFLAKPTHAEILPDIPKIISRAQWGADENLAKNIDKEWPSEYAKPEKFVIHHTASSNLEPDKDGSGMYKSMVRNIFYYHTVSKPWSGHRGQGLTIGFGDIGYNYLIDPNGNIYEGRAGGNGVIGGHVYGFNTGSIGIAVLGTYGGEVGGKYVDHGVTQKIQDSLTRLIGWIAANNNIDPELTSLFGSKLIPGVVGHKDLAPTQCPGGSLWEKLSLLRSQTQALAQKYENYLYQVKGENSVYTIRGGQRLGYSSLDLFKNRGGAYTKLSEISSVQLEAYSTSDFSKFADGTLLKEKGSGVLYLIENGKVRRIWTTENEFLKLGFNQIPVEITSSELGNYPNGYAIKYGPDGALLKNKFTKEIFLIENGRKRKFTSEVLFAKLGYKWEDVIDKGLAELQTYLDSQPLTYPNGTLAKTASEPTVYILEDGWKRPIISEEVFKRLGYQWNKICVLSEEEATSYTLGWPLVYSSGNIVYQGPGSTVYLIEDGKKREFTSAGVFLTLGFDWNNLKLATAKELTNIPLGKPLFYPDGSIVYEGSGSPVYKIEEQKKREFPSAEIFTSLGFKWKDLLVVSVGELARYALGAIMGSSTSEPQEPQEPSEPEEPEKPEDPEPSSQPNIRIAIYSPEDTIKITANGSYKIYDCQNELQEIKATGGIKEIPYTLSACNRFVSDNEDTIFEILSYEDRPAWKPSLNDNRFRGKIEIKPSADNKKLWVINELPLEDYLKGVAETVNGDLLEYRKTMALASRTYALFYIQEKVRYSGESFHLKNTSNDQLYKGYNFEERAYDVVEGVEATQGEIITYNDKPIIAAYSSDSCGITKDARKIWGSFFDNHPYLWGGVKDPAGTTHHSSCPNFTAAHGAGISAAGARQMAEQGSIYQEILKAYYPGVKIEKIY